MFFSFDPDLRRSDHAAITRIDRLIIGYRGSGCLMSLETSLRARIASAVEHCDSQFVGVPLDSGVFGCTEDSVKNVNCANRKSNSINEMNAIRVFNQQNYLPVVQLIRKL